MKVSEYDKKLDWKHIQEEMSEMKKEFEAVNNAYKLQETALKQQQEDKEKLERRVHLLEVDLSLERVAYGRTSTRDYALKAFNQSTVSANWEGLGKHPVIENIYEDIKNRSTEEGRRADDVLRKLENNPDYDEFMEMLKGSWFYKELKEDIEAVSKDIAGIVTTQAYDRSQANKQDLKQRDKMSDLETGLEALEFVQSEMGITMTNAFMFEVGAWARSGYEPVADGLREMLKIPKEKPKVVNDDGEKTEQTEKPSQ